MDSSPATRHGCEAGSASAGGRSRPRNRRRSCTVPSAAGASAGRRRPRAGWSCVVIGLLVADDRRGFGLAAAFAIEGIPVRRITRASEFDGRVLVATSDQLDAAASALARRVPSVVIGDGVGAGASDVAMVDE